MLRRLRKTIQDAAASPTRGATENTNTSNDNGTASSDAASGFICPMCMKGFITPDDLQVHFGKAHSELESNVPQDSLDVGDKAVGDGQQSKSAIAIRNVIATEPLHAVSPKGRYEEKSVTNSEIALTDGDVFSVVPVQSEDSKQESRGDNGSAPQTEISDLEASLQEEKWYADELKTELEKMKAKNSSQNDELEIIKQQMTIAIKTNEDLAREKEAIVLKLATKSQECAHLQSSCDELKSGKLALAEINKNQTDELEKAAVWIRDLESQLVQRPGADDVLVLKKELVSVQTLMDRLTLDSETQKDEATQECKRLKEELKIFAGKYSDLKSEFDIVKTERQNSKSVIAESMQQKLAETNKLTEMQSAQMKKIYEDLTNVQTALEKEQHHSQTLAVENDDLQEKSSAKTQEINALEEKLKAHSIELSECKEKCSSLKSQLGEIEDCRSLLKTRLHDVSQLLENSQKEKDITSTEKDARIESLTHQLEDITSDHTATKWELERAISENNSFQVDCGKLHEICKKIELEKSLADQKYESMEVEIRLLLSQSNSNNARLQNRVEELENEAKISWSESQDEKLKIQASFVRNEKQLMQLQLGNERLQEELKLAVTSVEEERSKVSSYKISVQEMGEKIKILMTENSSIVQKVEMLERTLMETNEKLASEESEKKSVGEEVKRLQQEREDLLEKMEVGEGQAILVGQLKDENESLRKRLDRQDELHKQQMAQRNTVVKQYETDLAEYKNIMRVQQDDAEVLQSNVKDLELMVSSLQEKDNLTMSDIEAKSILIKQLEENLSCQKVETDGKIAALQRLLDDKTRECDRITASLETLKASNGAAYQKFEESRAGLQEQISLFQQENTISGMKLKELEQLVTREQQEIKNLTADAENARQQREQEIKVQKLRHAEKIAQLESAIKKSQVRIMSSKSELEALRGDKEEVDTKLSGSLMRLKASELDKEELSKVTSSLKAELESAKMQMKNYQVAFEKSKTVWIDDKATLEAKLARLNRDLNKEHAKEVEQLLQEKKEIQEENAAQLVKLQTEIASKVELIEMGNLKILELDSALNAQAADLSQVQMKLHAENENLSRSMANLTSKNNAFESDLANLTMVQKKMKEKIATQKVSITELEAEGANKDLELNETSNELEMTRGKLKEVTNKWEIASIQLAAIQLQAERDSLETARLERLKADLETSLQERYQQIDTLSENLNDVKIKLQSTESALQKNVDEVRSLGALVAEKEELTQRLEDDLNLEKQSHKEELSRMKYQLDMKKNITQQEKEAWKVIKVEMEEEWKAKQSQWLAERDELIQSQDTLKGAQQILINGKMELQKNLEKAQNDIHEERSKQREAESLHKGQLKAVEAKLDEESAKLEKSTNILKEVQDEKQKVEARLRLEVGTLRDNLDIVRSEWQSAIQQVEKSNAESDELKGQIVVLQATVQNNADERRALLERCIVAEQAVEQLQTNEKQMKHRLNDAQAAMHELGRENQAMQVKHTTVLSRQWADDKGAVECLACKRSFSITLRKHHCRHCGKIFCGDCSAKSAAMAASKKPVRVCEKCYDDLLIAQ